MERSELGGHQQPSLMHVHLRNDSGPPSKKIKGTRCSSSQYRGFGAEIDMNKFCSSRRALRGVLLPALYRQIDTRVLTFDQIRDLQLFRLQYGAQQHGLQMCPHHRRRWRSVHIADTCHRRILTLALSGIGKAISQWLIKQGKQVKLEPGSTLLQEVP